MHYTSNTIRSLVEHYREISTLNKVHALLEWDLNVNLPPKAASSRARQSSLITGLVTDRWLSPPFQKNLEKAAENQQKYSDTEQAIVRNLLHAASYYIKIPKALIMEFSEATSEAFMAWKEARQTDDFSLFEPHLEKIVRINRIIAEKLSYRDNPYDALLDLYEPGLTASACSTLFHALIPELRSIISRIQKSKNYSSDTPFVGPSFHYGRYRQKQLSLFVLRKMGYDMDAGRLDVSPHPFTIDLSRTDVRLTTRYNRTDIRESLTSTIHEAGHGLYEQGVSEEFDDTPLASGVSLGIHESQSRFWENQIGRSRQFVSFIMPVVHAFFPEQLGKADESDIFTMFNHVKPGLIRTAADEVTYNLHIALRFEIEEGLINERIKVSELPELWREKMKEYVGIVPETNADGLLQDVHWSYGSFGYFPTYTLGNLYAAQFTKKMRDDIDVDACAANGEFGTILSWLRENIHQHGSLYWPDELSTRVTGDTLNPKYFLEYITEKYSRLYE